MLRRFVPDMQDLFAQLERQLGEGDVEQRRDPAYHQGQRFHRWRQRPAGRASELEQALRRADPLRGMEILAGIRLDELRTLCDACLLRLQAMFGDVQAESASANSGAVAVPPRIQADPGSPASAAACRANNAMGVIRRYS